MATAAKVKSFKSVVDGEEIEFFPVESSSKLCARGYSAAKKKIYTRFSDGAQYEYPVPSDSVWKDFERAKSAGSFVHTQLSKTPYHRIDDWK